MKKLFAILLVLLFAFPAIAQYKGYPDMCTENSNLQNPGSSEYMTCRQKRAGTSTTNPMYTLAPLSLPSYFILKDWNSNLQLDVLRLTSLNTGVPNTFRGLVSASASMHMDVTTFDYYPDHGGVPNDAMDSTGLRGGASISMNAFYNTSAVGNPWSRWHGGNYSNDNVSENTIMPYVQAYLMARDADGSGTADRLVMSSGVDAGGLRVAPTTNSYFMVSPTAAQNTFANPFYNRLTDGVGVASIGTGVDANGLRVSPTTDTYFMVSPTAAPNATGNPFYFVITDGVDNVDVLNSFQLTMPLALNVIPTMSGMYAYDGTDWAIARMDASNGIITGRTWTIAGEDDGNDWTKTKKSATGTTSPDKQTSTGLGTALSTVYTSREILGDVNLCVYVDNTGANALTDFQVQVGPDNSVWIDLGNDDCDTTAAGAACFICVSNNGHRYMRVQAAALDASQTDVDVWYTSNKN